MSFSADKVSSTKPFVSTAPSCNKRRRTDARLRAGPSASRRAPGDRPARRHADVVALAGLRPPRGATSRLCGARRFGGHVDLPRMRRGRRRRAVLRPRVAPGRGAGARPRARRRRPDRRPRRGDRAPAGRLRLARTAADIDACRRDGAVAALLGIEGAHALEGDLDQLDAFARRGVRYLGLLHFSANEAGYPGVRARTARRRRAHRRGASISSRRCEAAGVIVDLAHINRRGFLDACAIAKRPPIVSHTGVLGAFEHWRNIDDAQLRAVADKGGVVGVIFYPRYLGGDGLEPVVKHLLAHPRRRRRGRAGARQRLGRLHHPDPRALRSARAAAPDRRAPRRRRERARHRQDPARQRAPRPRRSERIAVDERRRDARAA